MGGDGHVAAGMVGLARHLLLLPLLAACAPPDAIIDADGAIPKLTVSSMRPAARPETIWCDAAGYPVRAANYSANDCDNGDPDSASQAEQSDDLPAQPQRQAPLAPVAPTIDHPPADEGKHYAC